MYRKTTIGIKKIIAGILVISMLPFSDYANLTMVNAGEGTNYKNLLTSQDAVVSYGSEELEPVTEEVVDTVSDEAVDVSGEAVTGEAVHNNAATTPTETPAPTGDITSKIENLESLTISSNYTLAGNMEVKNLTITGGTLNLNGYSLTVYEDILQTGGTLNFNKGLVNCYGNYSVSGNSYVYMTYANDYMYVSGSITWENTAASYNKLTNGVIEVGGDFTQSSKTSFQPSSYHKVIFNGTQKQSITMNLGGSKFNIIEFKNYSEEGIYSDAAFLYNQLIRNNCNLSMGNAKGDYGYTLSEDVTIERDYNLVYDTLNLNGHTMTIKGDLIQAGGTIDVSGGSLIVEGDYRLQTRNGEEGDYTYSRSTGLVIMETVEDYIYVGGSFVTETNMNHNGYLTNGIMEVKGDFTQLNTYSDYSFIATGSHKLLLSGTEEQTVSFATCTVDKSRIRNLEITNESTDGIVFSNRPFVSGQIKDNENKVNNLVTIGAGTSFYNNVYGGSVYVSENKTITGNVTIKGSLATYYRLTIKGTLNVQGSCGAYAYSGCIYMNGGRLNVDLHLAVNNYDYNSNAGLYMSNANDYIYVGGNFYYYTKYNTTLKAGTLEVAGNFNAYADFRPSETHKVILSGNSKQTVIFKGNNCFATLELQNYSEEGVYSDTALPKTTLIRNGCKLTYGDLVGEFGWTLSGDENYEGDLVLLDDTLDLNGHTLTVKGNLIHAGGTVKVNNGTLIIEKDYLVKTRTGEEGSYTYSNSNGILCMQNEADYVLVKGNFAMQSIKSHKGSLTNGVLEIKGNFNQYTAGVYDNFYATNNHKVLFSGDTVQKITAASNHNYYNQFANLEITNESTGGITFYNIPYVTGQVKDNGCIINGYIAIGSTTSFGGNVYSGHVYVIQDKIISSSITIKGHLNTREKLTVKGTLNLGGTLEVTGAYGQLYMQGGKVYVGQIFNYKSGKYGLYMANANDYLYVGGEFKYQSGYAPTASAGTIEVAGNFTATGVFRATGSNKVILSGTAKQTVYMSNSSYFATLELQNYSEEGVYSSAPLSKTTLVRNGCKLTYGSLVGEFGWTLSEDETYEGDFVLIDDILDLNGHTLTIKGDLIQAGGVIKVNNGTLVVEGAYRLQSRSGEEGAYTYSKSSGRLVMQNEADYILVEGSFITETAINHSGYLTNGVLEVQGNFTQSCTYTNYSFVSTNKHKVLLSGEAKQTVTFAADYYKYSPIANLEITNESQDGIVFARKPYVTGQVINHGNKTSGYIAASSGTSFGGTEYTGNVHFIEYGRTIGGSLTIHGHVIVDSRLTISGDFQVDGNLTVLESSGYLYMQGGKLSVSGNLVTYNSRYSYGIYMANAKDYIYVGGNFYYSTYYCGTLSAGTIEVAGNFTTTGTFNSRGTHKVILSGDKKQTISISGSDKFNILELQNYSDDGVYSATLFNKTTLIRNGCRLTYGVEGICGWTLAEDYVAEGDMVLIDDTLDLNGHTLTVRGDLIHTAGNIKINGGMLIVEGDYRLQTRSGKEGSYSYSAGKGRLDMNNAADKVLIKSDYIIQPSADMGSNLKEGQLEIQGDFKQLGSYAFKAGSNHTLIFSGNDAQYISGAAMINAGGLKINNTSEEYVYINCELKTTGKVTDISGNVAGNNCLRMSNLANLADNKWSGHLDVIAKNTLASDLYVGRSFKISAAVYVDTYTVYAGYMTVNSDFYVQNGTINSNQNFTINNSGRLIMQEEAGYVLVVGNFSISSQYSHSGLLTNGTLEVRGDFTQSSAANFIASDNHQVILSRKTVSSGRTYIQTISFANPGTAKMNKLILKKNLEAYQFQNNIEDICNEVIYDIEDYTPPTEITRLLAEKTDVTSVTICYGGAEDESGIAGYEVYRNGIKIGSTSNTSFKDTGLEPATTYIYTVYAFDGYGNMASESPELSLTTNPDTQKPATPAALYVSTRTGSTITLSWNAASDNVETTGYRLYRDNELLTDALTSTNYKDTGLEKNVVYEYTIEAYDEAGNVSGRSKTVSATVASPSITYVSPKDYSNIGGNTVKLHVRFKNVGNSTGNKVKIEYKNVSGEWQMLAPTVLGQKVYDSTTFYAEYNWDISKLSGDKEYNIRYTLYDADDNTDVKEVTYLIDKEAPSVIENVEAESDNGIVKLKWDASISADCTKYQIFRAQVDTPASGQAMDVENADYQILAAVGGRYVTSYLDTDVTEGQTYVYKITARDQYSNESEASTPVAVTVDIDKKAPEVESILPKSEKINGTARLNVSAKDNRQVKAIHLQYRGESETEWKELALIQTEDGMTEYGNVEHQWDTTLLADGTYYINAVAVDANGNISKDEFTRRYIVDNTGISKIEITGCNTGSTNAQLHWADVNDSDFSYFQVERKTGDSFVAVGTVSDTLGYNITGLVPDETYVFRVVGYDKLGNRGIPSDEYTFTMTKDTTAPRITAVYPVSSRYKDVLKLQMQVKDNYAVDYGVFSYSRDNINFIEIATVYADTKSSDITFSKDFDISKLDEGNIYIKFEAYDTAGNKNNLIDENTEITTMHMIDRTAPDKVANLKSMDEEGRVALTWDAATQGDVEYYRIYRADGETGIYKMLKSDCKTKNYYDTTVSPGSTYRYKMEAVDMAGNVSEMSDEVVATVKEDEKAPEIKSMSPYDQTIIRANPTIIVGVVDNVLVDKIHIEYQSTDGTDGIWHEIHVEELNRMGGAIETVWNTAGLEEGTYHVRAYATDEAGNESSIYTVSYTLDQTAPEKPELTAKTEDGYVQLTISGTSDEDFAYYKFYRKAYGEVEYKLLQKNTKTSYRDYGVVPEQLYSYMVEAYDTTGNCSRSQTVSGYANDKDLVPPEANMTEYVQVLAGYEIEFDGTQSKDNVRITEYKWNFGNGDTATGAKPSYIYEEAGVYTVILTVKDAAGNTDSATTTVEVLEQTGQGTIRVQVVDAYGVLIPYASVYMQISEEEKLSLKADSNGFVTIAAKEGIYHVAAFQDGYLPSETEVTVSRYETKEYKIVLESGELVVGELTVRRLELQEMLDAGVDLTDPKNYNSYAFSVVLGFQDYPLQETVEVISNGEIKEYTFDLDIPLDSTPPDFNMGDVLEKQNGRSVKVAVKAVETDEGNDEVPILTYLTTANTVSWLKDMYSVELGVLNAADSKYVIEDASATLNLPVYGVSLAGTHDGQQLTQSMGDIRGQEKKTVRWIVRGDKSGEYTLSADFEGTLMPFEEKVSAHFETKNAFQVYTGEGMKIYIMPEKTAYPGENYFVQFKVVNESDRNFYNFKTTFGIYTEETPIHEITIKVPSGNSVETIVTGQSVGTLYQIPELSRCSQMPVLYQGDQLMISVLHPGESVYGTFYIPFEGKKSEKKYYELVEYFAESIGDNNMGVELIIQPIEGHITKSVIRYKLPESTYGDPVQLTTGAFEDEKQVLSITGAAKADFTMDYNSRNASVKGELGYGWTHNYESRIAEANGMIYFYTSSSAYACFVSEKARNGEVYGTVVDGTVILDGTYKSTGIKYTSITPGMDGYSILKNEDGGYTVITPAKDRYLYNSDGLLVKMTDETGQSISFTRNDKQTIITEDASGKRMKINYNEDGLITSVEDDYGRKSTFAYENGCLKTYTNPLGEVTTYTYDDNNRILTASNDMGVTYVTNEYDYLGRVVRQYNASSEEVINFRYEAIGTVSDAALREAGLTSDTLVQGMEALTGGAVEGCYGTLVTVTDEEGNEAVMVVDAMGRMVRNINQNNSATTYEYDKNNNLLSVTNTEGDKTSYTYNSSQDMISMTDSEGNKMSYTYDANGNVTSITGPDGKKTAYKYNERNLMTESMDYAGKKTTYEYNEDGLLTKETVEGLGSREYAYTDGLLTCTTDYKGNKNYIDYDSYGNVIRTEDALGNITTFECDMLGRILKETDGTGAVTTYAYDCNGNMTSQTDKNGNTTTYKYDGNGRCIKETYADGTSTSYEYNLKGEKTAEIYADKTRHTYDYDGAGNVIRETFPDGSVVRYEYDALNMCTRMTDASGDAVSYEYNSLGKVTKETNPDGTYVTYEYDVNNRLASVCDKEGNTTSYTYDSMSNVICITDALGNQVKSTYDIYGNLTSSTDANGNVTQYVYDANGNCISVTNALGEVVYYEYDANNRLVKNYLYKDGREISQSYTYDALGRVITTTDELGNITKVSYDSNGNIYQMTDAKGNVVSTNTYNSMNRLISQTDAMGYVATYSYDEAGCLTQTVQYLNTEAERKYSYTYDALGRIKSSVDPLEGNSSYTYDADGNIATVTDPNGGVTTYTYDSMGRTLSSVNAIGSKNTYEYNARGLLEKATNGREQDTTYEYDALGRITSMTDELGTIKYTYDANGNVLTVSDESGTIERTYDELNRIKTYTDYKGNTIGYGYDELGNLISLTYPGGEIVRYTYYDNGYLHTVTDENGNITSYEYDANGNLIKTTRPDGSVETRTYNEANWLLQISDKTAAGEVINQYDYTYDEKGNITGIRETTPDAVTVDDVEADSDTTSGNVASNIKNVDLSAVISATMTYDAANRLISYNGEEVKYDADGNMIYGPVNGKMVELDYDCRNRLIRAGDTTYEYDAENIRTAIETPEYREEYVTDSSGELSKVLVITRYYKDVKSEDGDSGSDNSTDNESLSDTDSTDNNSAEYVSIETTLCYYGNGLLYERTGEELLIFHYNNIGSTTCITDQTGAVVERYDYGTYGELLSGDISITSFLYNGQYGVMNDANGLYYMRARYYNPEIKRFINQDVVNGDITNSQSLNKYCYVQGNPVSLIDPFGLSPLGSFSSIGHTVLDVIGFIPGIGDIADGINAVWYMAEGNWAMAAASAISLLPFGDILAKGGKFLVRGGKKIAKVVSNVAGASVDIFAHATSFASRGAKLFGKFGDVALGGLMLGGAAIKKGADFIGSKISKGVDFVSSKISKSVDADDVARVTKNADVKTSKGGSNAVYIPKDVDGNPIPLNKQRVKGQDIPLPDPAAEGRPHTVLGGKVSSETGEVYRQSATFKGGSWPTANGYEVPISEVHWTNHGRTDVHTNPHQHVFIYDFVNRYWFRSDPEIF